MGWGGWVEGLGEGEGGQAVGWVGGWVGQNSESSNDKRCHALV